jgi:hypothetical protein
MTLHRIVTYVVTVLAALVGFAFFFVSVFQCAPVDFFWTRLQGETNGKCIDIEVMIDLTYLYGTVTALTDIAWGVLVATLTWNLKVDIRTKMLIAPLLAMACMYVENRINSSEEMLIISQSQLCCDCTHAIRPNF